MIYFKVKINILEKINNKENNQYYRHNFIPNLKMKNLKLLLFRFNKIKIKRRKF